MPLPRLLIFTEVCRIISFSQWLGCNKMIFRTKLMKYVPSL